MAARDDSTLTAGEAGSGGAGDAVAQLFVVLECARPVEPPLAIRLDEADTVVVARGEQRECAGDEGTLELRIPDARLSTLHARLRAAHRRWMIEDAGSKNGTWINGVRRDSAVLEDGDVIEVGHTFLMFREAVPVADGARAPLPELRTHNAVLARQLRALADVAASMVSVLLLGESGTGKEVMARAVHRLSGRLGAFVAVNCGAIPEALVEAELFGHRKGAFSGALESREGLVRAAHGGTLFLDEISDLAPASQAALLRVLQEREVVPVGETRPIKVDLRIIAATHRDPGLYAEERFRSDLRARLSGLTVRLLPLRERREDLGLLIGALLPRVAADPGRIRFGRDAGRALFAYGWPLNVRELEKALETATTLARSGTIELEHLVQALPNLGPGAAAPSPALAGSDAALREQLVAALQQSGGNVTEVAKQMGRTRMQIHRWVKRWRIDLASFRR